MQMKRKRKLIQKFKKKNVTENFSAIYLVIFRIFSEFVEKMVLIREIVLFFGVKKPY